MLKRIVFGMTLVLLLTGTLTSAFKIQPVEAEPVTIYIRADGSIDPPTSPIQRDGATYMLTGNITSDADGIVIERSSIVLDGAGFVLSGNSSGRGIFLVDESNVTIRNSTIKNFEMGIQMGDPEPLVGCANCSICGNNITGNWRGIRLFTTSSTRIFGNTIANNGQGNYGQGIILEYACGFNTIYDNNVTNNYDGISIDQCNMNNVVFGNHMAHNGAGIVIGGSIGTVYGNNITNGRTGVEIIEGHAHVFSNTMSRNGKGVAISCGGGEITGNLIEDSEDGIVVDESEGISLVRNNITHNERGLTLIWAGHNNITENSIENSGTCALYMDESSGNKFYHNNFTNNKVQTYSDGFINVWDNGYPSGGNLWSDYRGHDLYCGPYQNETGSDGIGDTPYVIDEGNKDNYPFLPLKFMPLASFTWAPVYPIVYDIVTLNASDSYDLDGQIVSYAWDFGDGAAITEGDPLITHAYTTANTYTVMLNVTDNDGLTDTVKKSINVGKLSSSISVSASPAAIVIGQTTTISGFITPKRIGATVTVLRRLGGLETWSVQTIRLTDENSRYSYVWMPLITGTYELKASWQGDLNTFGAESSIITVTVLSPFADGFESGSFNQWSGTSISGGEVAAVTNSRSHHGTYSALFTSNGDGGGEVAKCLKILETAGELHARGYFYVSKSGLVTEGSRFYLITFNAAADIAVAYAGWRRIGGVVKWTLAAKDGTVTVYNYSTVIPQLNRWYCVELHWKKDSANGLAEMWVDGAKVLSLARKNTAAYPGVAFANFGLAWTYQCGPTSVYCDCARMSATYIDLEPTVKSFSISPNPFSPNGDGSKDTTVIKATFNKNVNWNLQVRTASGKILRTWTGTGSSLSIIWDGKNSTGYKVADGTYSVRLSGYDTSGVPFTTKYGSVTVDTRRPAVTSVSVYPASFNPRTGQSTRINYTLSESCYITIKIYNSTGALKRTLLYNVLQTSGLHSVLWNGKDSSGVTVPAGTYTIKIYVIDKSGNKPTPYPIIKTVTVV